MSSYAIGAIFGSFIGYGLFFAVFGWGIVKFAKLPLFWATVPAYACSTVLSAYGNANGGPVNWNSAVTVYAIPALVFLSATAAMHLRNSHSK